MLNTSKLWCSSNPIQTLSQWLAQHDAGRHYLEEDVHLKSVKYIARSCNFENLCQFYLDYRPRSLLKVCWYAAWPFSQGAILTGLAWYHPPFLLGRSLCRRGELWRRLLPGLKISRQTDYAQYRDLLNSNSIEAELLMRTIRKSMDSRSYVIGIGSKTQKR